MRQLDEITYKVADILGKRNDVPFIMSCREATLDLRAMFLRRDFDKNMTYRTSSLQNLGNLKLQKVKENEFTVLQKVCSLKRTVEKIPLPVETKHFNHFAHVGGVDGAPAFQYSSEFEIENVQYQLFPNVYPPFFYKDGYIYVADYDGNTINVKAMFRDPREVAKAFENNIHANCSVVDTMYIPDDMVHDIESELIKKYGNDKPEEATVNSDQIEL
jgi:hypothetical protein